MEIIKADNDPENKLRQKCNLVETLDESHLDLIFQMEKIIIDSRAYGLSANQVGILERVFIINKGTLSRPDFLIMFNPTLTPKTTIKKLNLEGCLSIPDKSGYVLRYESIEVKYYVPSPDLKTLDKRKLKAVGLLSSIIQHEIDHLNGILFTDKIALK